MIDFYNLPAGTEFNCVSEEKTYLLPDKYTITEPLNSSGAYGVRSKDSGYLGFVLPSWFVEGHLILTPESIESMQERPNYIKNLIAQHDTLPHLVECCGNTAIAHYHIRGDVYKHEVVGEVERWEIIDPLAV